MNHGVLYHNWAMRVKVNIWSPFQNYINDMCMQCESFCLCLGFLKEVTDFVAFISEFATIFQLIGAFHKN